MAFSSGTFSRLYSWVDDRDNGVKIRADRFDAELDGIATALSTAILKDGTQTITADIPWNGNKITGLGDPTSAQDAATKTYVDTNFQPLDSDLTALAAVTDVSHLTDIGGLTLANGDIFYVSGGAITNLAKGTDGQYLSLSSGLPAWADVASLTVSGSAIQKGDGAGGLEDAVSGTDYAPATSGTAILKGDGSGGFGAAASGTDYAPATSGTAILKGDGSGGFAAAVAGTDYLADKSPVQLATSAAGTGTQVDFTNISQDYSVLHIVVKGVSHSSGTGDNFTAIYSGDNLTTTSLWNYVGPNVAAGVVEDFAITIFGYTNDVMTVVCDIRITSTASDYAKAPSANTLQLRIDGGLDSIRFYYYSGASFDAGNITIYAW